MEVLHSEGVATHTGPKPCVGSREEDGEASAGERAGWPLSRESRLVPGADGVTKSEGNTVRRVSASGGPTWRGQRPQHAWTLLAVSGGQDPRKSGGGVWVVRLLRPGRGESTVVLAAIQDAARRAEGAVACGHPGQPLCAPASGKAAGTEG